MPKPQLRTIKSSSVTKARCLKIMSRKMRGSLESSSGPGAVAESNALPTEIPNEAIAARSSSRLGCQSLEFRLVSPNEVGLVLEKRPRIQSQLSGDRKTQFTLCRGGGFCGLAPPLRPCSVDCCVAKAKRTKAPSKLSSCLQNKSLASNGREDTGKLPAEQQVKG